VGTRAPLDVGGLDTRGLNILFLGFVCGADTAIGMGAETGYLARACGFEGAHVATVIKLSEIGGPGFSGIVPRSILGRLQVPLSTYCCYSLTTEPGESIAGLKELFESSSAEWIPVQQKTRKRLTHDTFLADSDVLWKANCFPLNIPKQVNMVRFSPLNGG